MTSKTVYQFKITLQDAPLPIWRIIQVPSTYSFWDLHVAIQDVMGWKDYHLHDFMIINPRTGTQEHIGIPDEDSEGPYDTKPGWELKIRSYFNDKNILSLYEYDFGDSWEHLIKFEGQYKQDSEKKYPVCLAGRNACPPEDVGGVQGYENFLRIITDPKHEEYEAMLIWTGTSLDKPFDPCAFDPKQVEFDNPKKRWRMTFTT